MTEPYDYNARFGGIARLFSTQGLAKLHAAHVLVVGIGGVGSWTVESLVRSGIGRLTLVDLDDICASNVNRQLHALDPEFGRAKVDVMAERARAISPECQVTVVPLFFTPASANEILSTPFDFAVDAIDGMTNKAFLLAQFRQAGLRVVTCGSAGGRREPGAIRIDDLALATHDPLLRVVRRKLREDHSFPAAGEMMGIEAVYSVERPVFPQKDGTVCSQRDPEADLRLSCEGGYGTASFVTGAFGLAAAGVVVRRLTEEFAQRS